MPCLKGYEMIVLNYFTALILAWLLAPPSLRGAEANVQSLVCLNTKCDFGKVYEDAVVKHQFILTNQGSRVVNIGRVHAACGCTKTLLTTNVVPPGMTAALSVEFDARKRRGHQSKAIYCETDDPVNRVIRMEISGVVLVPIDIQPEGINFGTVGATEKLTRDLSLIASGTNIFHIRTVTISPPLFCATVETREAGKSYVIKVSNDGGRSIGSSVASIQVQTDNPLMGSIDIPVAAVVAGDIVSTPGTLLLIPSPTNVVRTSWLSLSSPPGKAFKVTYVECSSACMTNTVKYLTPDRTRIEIKTWGPLTGLAGKCIRVGTDLPSMRELLIPLRVLSIPGGQLVPGKP